MNQGLTPTTLLKINNLFKLKGWDIDKGESMPSVYESFCNRVSLFKREEQELIIDLTEDFTLITLREYLEKFYDSLICIGDEIFETKAKLFVYPLISLEKAVKIDPFKIKSGQFLHYMIGADDYRWLSPKLIFSESIRDFDEKFDNADSCLILIDDYIGSGETAEDTCKWFLDRKIKGGNAHAANVKIVTLAAQSAGISRIKQATDVDVCSNIILKKGITDRFTGADLEVKTELMKSIEAKLRIKQENLFGYQKTEALVTFMRKTPNNTFPIYWHETKSQPAPFPRYKK